MAEKQQKGAHQEEQAHRRDWQLFHDAQRLGIGGGTLMDLLELVDSSAAQVLVRVLAWYSASNLGSVGAHVNLDAALPRGGSLEGLRLLWRDVVKDQDAVIKGWLPDKELKAYDGLAQKLLG